MDLNGDAEPLSEKPSWQETWEDSKGMLLILVSESFGTCMAAATRLLEDYGSGMSVLQVRFLKLIVLIDPQICSIEREN